MDTTNPEAEVVSPEARLEALFSKGQRPAVDTPEEPEEEEQAEQAEETTEEEAVGDDQAETEGEGSETDEATEEIELDGGKKYLVPKDLKEAFLKSRDYTQKTQEVAQQRRALEEREQYLQTMEKSRGVIFEKAVAINALEQRIEQFAGINWQALADQDPAEYLKLDRAYRELQTQHSRMAGEVQTAIAQEQQLSAQQRQQMLERGNAELAREIKDWGPDLGKKLLDNGKRYGFSDAELAQVMDPRLVRVLHDAYQWQKLQGGKPAIAKKVEGVKPVTVKAARSAQTNQQASQVQADRAKLKKSGSARDAENYLARLFESKRKR